MRLGIVSDTHGQVEFTRAAVRMLEALDVDEVVHCGDIGSPAILPLFSGWPTHYVFGNVDRDESVLRAAIEMQNHTCHERFGSIQRCGRQVAFLHGDNHRLLQSTIADGSWDLVCYGHTHVADQQQHGKTLALNPGAVYRARPHTIATVGLPELAVNIVTV